MGIIEFIVLVVVLVLVAYLAIWVMGQLAPGHPVIVDKVIWVLVVVILALMLLRAIGLMGLDPQIPRVR
jgi:hypothetical protein